MLIPVENNQFRMIAKTLYGLEDLLADELASIGAANTKKMNRSVEFYGDQAVLYKANMHCRLAGRVLVPIAEFVAMKKTQLYNRVRQLSWQEILKPEKTFCVDSLLSHSRNFDNSMYISLVAKDAVVDKLREGYGRRPSIDTDRPDVRINLHMNQNRVTISLDASGTPLHKRGYRTSGGQAPINELLAAGIITLSGWKGDTNFVDGMAGSGTIPIEAALIATNTIPGLLRSHYAFKLWPDFDKGLYNKILDEARSRVKNDLDFEILCSDKDKHVLNLAKDNVKRAGVDKLITIKKEDYFKLEKPDGPGVCVMNPPYGERMEMDQAVAFYKKIGDRLKNHYTDYRASILTGHLKAAKHVGLRPTERIKLYNGPIESRLLNFDIYSGSR